MSLGPCKACGKQVSKDAKVCPLCGEPNPVVDVFAWLLPVVIILVFFVIGKCG